jgi:UDP-glucuronate decarboxylase
VFRALPENDPKRRQPDLTLAKARLGYAPRVAWDEGLSNTIAYFREILGTGSIARIQRGPARKQVAAV